MYQGLVSACISPLSYFYASYYDIGVPCQLLPLSGDL